MKKQILNIGTVLSKEEQKNVFGGVHQIRHYDPYCDEAHETYLPQGCPCTMDSQCANMPNPNYGSGTAFVQGSCVSGECVA